MHSRNQLAALLALATAALAVIADFAGLLDFLGLDGGVLIRFLAGLSMADWIIILLSACSATFAGAAFHFRNQQSRLKGKLVTAHDNIRKLVHELYSDATLNLERYERVYRILNEAGEAELRKTYVLTAAAPVTEMTSYVELREDDDASRVFQELQDSCQGADIRDGFRLLRSTEEELRIMGLTLDLRPPVTEEEHTISMACRLQSYFGSDGHKETVHMALPTKRSIIRIQHPNLNLLSEETVVEEPPEYTERSLGNQAFSRIADNELKWEFRDPVFGAFYTLHFTSMGSEESNERAYDGEQEEFQASQGTLPLG